MKKPLYKNSLFLILSRFLNVAVGFVFWIISAKLYSIDSVGFATVLISSSTIVISFSRLGFDFSLIRFIRIYDKHKVFNTALVVTSIASIIIGVIYILGFNSFSSSLFGQKLSYIIIFLIFVLMSSIVSITGITLTAIRRTEYYFFQNILLALRVPLLFPLVFLGSFGIFGSMGLAYLFSALITFLHLRKFVSFDLKIDNQFIKESFSFSSGNYVSSIFLTIPILILPILISSLLGNAETAKFYIAFAIGNLVLIIPEALCTSLFVEGSHGESLRKNVIRASLTIYSLLIPAVIFIYLYGRYLLTTIGNDYVDALELLRLLVISSFFVAVCSIFISIQNIQMKVENILKLNLVMFLLLPILSYILIPMFGIVGVGYAWIITYIVLDLIVYIMIKKVGWIMVDKNE